MNLPLTLLHFQIVICHHSPLFIKSHSGTILETEFTKKSGVLQATAFPMCITACTLCDSAFLFFMPMCFPDVSFHTFLFNYHICLLEVAVCSCMCVRVCVGCYLVGYSGCEMAASALGQRQSDWGRKERKCKESHGKLTNKCLFLYVSSL